MSLDDDIHINQDSRVFGGRPVIEDHCVTIHDIVALYKHGESPNEIATDFELTRRGVAAALAYYQDRRVQIDREIAEDRRITSELAERDHSPAAKRLRAAWNARRTADDR